MHVSYKIHLHLTLYQKVMIFQKFSFIMLLPVAWQNNTVMPTWVAWQYFLCQKHCLTWQMLLRQCMWHDNVILSRQKCGHDQKCRSWKKIGTVIIKTLNRKGLKIKKIPIVAHAIFNCFFLLAQVLLERIVKVLLELIVICILYPYFYSIFSAP